MPTPRKPNTTVRKPNTSVRLPRINVRAIRPPESTRLDGAAVKPRGEPAQDVPPFVPWASFYPWFGQYWEVGPPDWPNPNMAIVGMAGSGKTTLARELLRVRDYVVVFGTKTKDASLYKPLEDQGYVITDKFDPGNVEHPKVIFRPPLSEPTTKGLEKQREAFREALLGIFDTGGWCVYLDEVRYLSETLKLHTELDLLWLQGRSLGVSIVASTQRPVSVPLNMFEQSAHSFLFRITSRDDRARAAEFTGPNAGRVFETVSLLPPHEVLYIDSVHDTLVRTRVA